MVMPNDDRVDMDGLASPHSASYFLTATRSASLTGPFQVVDYVSLQRQYPDRDFERFVELDASPLPSPINKYLI